MSSNTQVIRQSLGGLDLAFLHRNLNEAIKEYDTRASNSANRLTVYKDWVRISPTVGGVATGSFNVEFSLESALGIGPINLYECFLVIELGPVVLAGGAVGTYNSGYALQLIRDMRFMNGSARLDHLDAHSIRQHYETYPQRVRTEYLNACRVSATASGVSYAADCLATYLHAIKIPTRFGRPRNVLPQSLGRNSSNHLAFVFDFAALTDIAVSAPAGNLLSVPITQCYMLIKRLDVPEYALQTISENTIERPLKWLLPRFDFQNAAMVAGSASYTIRLTGNGLTRAIYFFPTDDNIPTNPFTPVAIQSWFLRYNNIQWPTENAIPTLVRHLENCMDDFEPPSISFERLSIADDEDDSERFDLFSGAIRLEKLSNPELVITFAGVLATNHTLHIYYYGCEPMELGNNNLLVPKPI
jgi:hypothetical protein